MREIKFRAWDKDLQKFRHIDHIIFDWESNPWKIFVREPNEVGCILFMYEVELMQFTGLHDKNGKEIYEGDIIRQKKTTGAMFKVEWDKLDGQWQVEPVDKHQGWDRDTLWRWYKVSEVIGNVYEQSSETSP